MTNAKPARTPMATTTKLSQDLGRVSVDHTYFRSMIGSLLYLTSSRPDISYSVRVCARYQAGPKKSHVVAIKRIIKYIKGTTSLGLFYPYGTHVDLVAYTDAD